MQFLVSRDHLPQAACIQVTLFHMSSRGTQRKRKCSCLQSALEFETLVCFHFTAAWHLNTMAWLSPRNFEACPGPLHLVGHGDPEPAQALHRTRALLRLCEATRKSHSFFNSTLLSSASLIFNASTILPELDLRPSLLDSWLVPWTG